MNLRRIIKEEVNDFENLNWIDKISDKWVPKAGDKFICKPGFKRLSDYDYHPDRYGGAAYIPGKVYTIDHIGPHYHDDDHMVLFTVEDENNNGVFKKAAEPYFEYLEESTSDFGWSENTGYEFTKEINTKKANQNFNNEVNGYYAISTPKGKDFPETILAYGPIFYIKQVLSYINDLDDPYWGNMDLYLGKITYSKKDKDNILSLTKYY